MKESEKKSFKYIIGVIYLNFHIAAAHISNTAYIFISSAALNIFQIVGYTDHVHGVLRS